MTATWKSFQLQVPGKDALEPIRNVLETLMIYLEVLKAILELIKKFLIDIGNPIKALVAALMAMIQMVIESLNQTGIYGYFDVPMPNIDPNFVKQAGGSPAFIQRFTRSLYNNAEPNRPQPVKLLNQSGFIVLMVSADGILEMIRLINAIYKFFSRDATAAKYVAPANMRCLPLGPKGDPILAIASIFSTKLTGVALEWTLPTSQATPTRGFNDVLPSIAAEFVPKTWLVEKSAIPVNREISEEDLIDNPESAGWVMCKRLSPFQVQGKQAVRKEHLRDAYGESIQKFQKYYIVDTSSPTFWMGQLGTFRWVDTEVEPDKIYYYRVRAFSGNLAYDSAKHTLKFTKASYNPNNPNTFVWPSADSSPVSMGNPSGVMQIRLPVIPKEFDMVSNLERLFQTAFALNFHLPCIPSKDSTGKVLRPVFVTSPDPANPKTVGVPATPETLVTDIGIGSLEKQAGPLAMFDSLPVVSVVTSLTSITTNYQPDPVTGQLPKMPWQSVGVRFQSARLADGVAKNLFNCGTGAIDGIRSRMQSMPQYGLTNIGVLQGKTTISQMVFALTDRLEDGAITTQQAVTYGQVFSDANFRLNILSVVNYINSVAMGGGGVNWVSICFLRDIVPWSGQILYRIVAYIQALLDAFKGVLDEIKAFIELIERKIAALERFIQFLIQIMEFILSLSVSCYALNSGTMTQGIEEWVSTINNAEGQKPPNNPAGYSAGIVLAYVAPNVALYQAAFNAIF